MLQAQISILAGSLSPAYLLMRAGQVRHRLEIDFRPAGDSSELLVGRAGNDTIFGGTGNDAIYGGHDKDWVLGDEGDDALFGDNGSLTVTFRTGQLPAGVTPIAGGDDTIAGGLGKDKLHGDDGDDRLTGGRFVNDTTVPSATPTIAEATNWSDGEIDTLEGGKGNDTYYVGAGVQNLQKYFFWMGFPGATGIGIISDRAWDLVDKVDDIDGIGKIWAYTIQTNFSSGDGWPSISLRNPVNLTGSYTAQTTVDGQVTAYVRNVGGTDNHFNVGGTGDDYYFGGEGSDQFFMMDGGIVTNAFDAVLDFEDTDFGGTTNDYIVLPEAARVARIIFDQGGYYLDRLVGPRRPRRPALQCHRRDKRCGGVEQYPVRLIRHRNMPPPSTSRTVPAT